MRAALAALAAFALLAGCAGDDKPDDSSKPAAGKKEVMAEFDATLSSSVEEGTGVVADGADVGEVVSVLREPDEATVVIEIDEAIDVHIDATLRVRSLEGDIVLELDPGSPQAQPLLEDESIPKSRTNAVLPTP